MSRWRLTYTSRPTIFNPGPMMRASVVAGPRPRDASPTKAAAAATAKDPIVIEYDAPVHTEEPPALAPIPAPAPATAPAADVGASPGGSPLQWLFREYQAPRGTGRIYWCARNERFIAEYHSTRIFRRLRTRTMKPRTCMNCLNKITPLAAKAEGGATEADMSESVQILHKTCLEEIRKGKGDLVWALSQKQETGEWPAVPRMALTTSTGSASDPEPRGV